MAEERRVLVTGATGMLGTHVLAALLGRGRRPTAWLLPGESPEALVGRVRDLQAFLREEPENAPGPRALGVDSLEVEVGPFTAEALGRVLPGHASVVHAAGQVRGDDPARMEAGNVGTVRALVAAAGWSPAHCLVHVSSVAAQGPGRSPDPVHETDPPRTQGVYGATKRRGEEVLEAAALPARTLVARPCSILGPLDGNFLGVFRAARDRGVYVRLGTTDKWFQLVYAPDLARALALLLEALEAGREPPSPMHVVGDEVLVHDAFRSAVEATVGRPVRNLHVGPWLTRLVGAWGSAVERLTGEPRLLCADKMADMLSRYWVHSPARLRRTLPALRWTPLYRACARTAAWYRARGEL